MTSNRFFAAKASVQEDRIELEGGAPAEEESLRRSGCEDVSLGKRVVRADTAALCAASAVILMWNR